MSDKVQIRALKAGQKFKDLDKESNYFNKTMVCSQAYIEGGRMIAYDLHDKEGEEPVGYIYPAELVELVE